MKKETVTLTKRDGKWWYIVADDTYSRSNRWTPLGEWITSRKAAATELRAQGYRINSYQVRSN